MPINPAGGTEVLKKALDKVFDEYAQDIEILSLIKEDTVLPRKKLVFWQHLFLNDPHTAIYQNKNIMAKVDQFVFVSHWQQGHFCTMYNLPLDKCMVIKNAANATEYKPKQKTDKLKLIYTSTPWRGLDVLLKAFELLKRDDVELHVYSSLDIYGAGFKQTISDKDRELYEQWFKVAGLLPNSYYHGYATNEEILKQLQDTHILAYPSIFQETSCLAAIEAMMAGCKVVTTNFGALPETCGDWATYVPYGRDRVDLAKRYAEVLNQEIDRYWDEANQKRLERQVAHYNDFYSWDARIPQWRAFLDGVRKAA